MVDRIAYLQDRLTGIVEDPESAGIHYTNLMAQDSNSAGFLEIRSLLDNAKEYLTILEFCTKNLMAANGLEMINKAIDYDRQS